MKTYGNKKSNNLNSNSNNQNSDFKLTIFDDDETIDDMKKVFLSSSSPSRSYSSSPLPLKDLNPNSLSRYHDTTQNDEWLISDFSKQAADDNNVQAKRKKQPCEEGTKNSKARIEQFGENVSDSSNPSNYKFTAFTKTRKNKDDSLKDLITDGDATDVMFLKEKIDQFKNGKAMQSFKFLLHIPIDMTTLNAERFKRWLDLIGFEEIAYGHGIAYNCKSEKLDELHKILKSLDEGRNNKKDVFYQSNTNKNTRPIKSKNSASEELLRIKTSFISIGDLTSLDQPSESSYPNLSINTNIPYKPRDFQDRSDSPNTEPPTPFSVSNDDLSPRSVLMRTDSSISRSMSNPSPLESGFLNMVQEKFLIESQFTLSSSINTIIEGTEFRSENNLKDLEIPNELEEVVDINEISHVSSIGPNHTEDSDVNLSKDVEQDISGQSYLHQSDVILPLKSDSSKDSLLQSVNICKPLFNKLSSGGRESSLLLNERSLFSPDTNSNSEPTDHGTNSNNTSMEVDQFNTDSSCLLSGLRRISYNDLKSFDSNKMEDDQISFQNNFPKIKRNNGGSHLKRSVSESEIARVSLSQYNEATLTPGPLSSLSHNEIDKLEGGKVVHYQTPQNMMFVPSKYELSEGADPKIIQLLMNKVNILAPPSSGDKTVDTIKRSATTPIQCIERGSINTYFSKGNNNSASNFPYKPVTSDEKIRFNNMMEKNARSSIVDQNNIPAITATSLTHHRSKSSDTITNLDSENICKNARMSFNLLSQTKIIKSSIADNIITKIDPNDSSAIPNTSNVQNDEVRNNKKIVKSKSKYRRMSVNMMQSQHESSVDLDKTFSPSAKPKTNITRRQSLVAAVKNLKNNANNMSQDDLNKTNITLATIENSSNIFDSHSQSFLDGLNEINFKGVVIGGTYQHCFENTCPVVAAPTSNDKRVVDAKIMSNNCLILRLFVPKDNACKEIDLSTNWKWMRSSPIGVLVYKQSFRKNKPFICYFLHKHPNDWHYNKRLSTVSSQMQLDVSHIDHSATDTYEIEMDSQPNLEEHANSVDIEVFECDISNQMDVDEVEEETFKSLAEGSGLSAEVAVWTNSGLIRLVLEFLIDKSGNNNNNNNSVGGVVITKSKGRKPKNKPVVNTHYPSVCKAWALSSFMITAQRLSKFERDDSFDWDKWIIFAGKYHWKFLSEGACKKVFLVQMENQSNAISVMDINDLLDRGMEHSITQELEISILCSSLVTLNICPNLIMVHSLFQANYPAPDSVWHIPTTDVKSRSNKPPLAVPKKNKMDKLKGKYQFIRMEFCSGGDVEELVRKRGQISISLVRSFLFQMCYSLYCCRDKLALRHYDIKLLNFFATSGSSIIGDNNNNNNNNSIEDNRDVNLQIAFGNKIFNILLEADEDSLIKLADFGTSVVGATGLGDPITIMQYTTLENTAPEFYLQGSQARQSYSSDTFGLGLSFLHLLTGYEPYEELLKDVHCPKYLYNKLRNIWYFSKPDSPYYIIKQVIDSLDCEDLKTQGNVLYDTLYRYMVLFGSSSSCTCSLDSNNLFLGCEVWSLLTESLCLKLSEEEINNILTKGLRNKEKTGCLSQFREDVSKWSIHRGNSTIMISVRDRLNHLGGDSWLLLESMLHFDPSQRCSMTDALNNSMFIELLNSNHDNIPNLPFLHYFRNSDELALDLPIL